MGVTVHETLNGRTFAYVKGSPAALLAASSNQLAAAGVSPMTPGDRQRFVERNQELASVSLRVLALAYKELPGSYDEGALGHDLTFVGLVGMEDPLRDEAKAAIATCREAGIRTVMITGDQLATAGEIARQLSIDQYAHGRPLQAVHGRDLNDLDAAQCRILTNGWPWGAVLLCLLLQAAAVYVPLLQRVLHTAVPAAADWAVIAACSLAPIPIVELSKLARRWVGSDQRGCGTA